MITSLLNGRRVLVVEDQYHVAMDMRRLVLQLGGEVIGPARDVAAADALLADGAAPDIAILDVNIDGARVYPLADTLRERGVPFLFATGYDTWVLDPRFRNAPHVIKPVSAPALIAALNTLIRQEAPA